MAAFLSGVGAGSRSAGCRRGEVATSAPRRSDCRVPGGTQRVRNLVITDLTKDDIKACTALLNVYSIVDKEGYPILQPMFGDSSLIGSLYFLSFEAAMGVVNQIKETEAELADGAQVAVVPFHIAYEKVTSEPIPTEDKDDQGRQVFVVFRFVPELEDLQTAQQIMINSGAPIENLPEIPIFYNSSDPPEQRTVFLSFEDCKNAPQNNESGEQPMIELGDLPTMLEADDKVVVIPCAKNKSFVDDVFAKAGMT